ncbi:SDR family NAD(P)-dependent oxidoreductase [Granulicella sp. L60]|uniref:SDR family NAD(P)-dependent oxidoreductase n=1 Tax=Granulicella sp. L60 TaxID=1641866 RepID=UPI0020B1257F|nr:SDR family NAD(P)-dependent oxidoreductase [Granulicella sp. L60]
MGIENEASYPSLRNRVIIVTGGASGIGASIVEAFAMQHAKVAFLDIDDAAAGVLISKVASTDATLPIYHHCDITDVAVMTATVEAIIGQLGAIDVLINNAGNDSRHTFGEVTSKYWDNAMAVNLKHHFFMAQAAVPSMKSAGRGSIINMSSISWAIPSTGLPVYVTAKAAIVGLTRTLAHELGQHNIRVNCVMPGAIQTERQKQLWHTEAYKAEILSSQALKRMILPDEVARLVLFLAAEDSSGITNQSFVIDGGWI